MIIIKKNVTTVNQQKWSVGDDAPIVVKCVGDDAPIVVKCVGDDAPIVVKCVGDDAPIVVKCVRYKYIMLY
jgi:hypothetical protein